QVQPHRLAVRLPAVVVLRVPHAHPQHTCRPAPHRPCLRLQGLPPAHQPRKLPLATPHLLPRLQRLPGILLQLPRLHPSLPDPHAASCSLDHPPHLLRLQPVPSPLSHPCPRLLVGRQRLRASVIHQHPQQRRRGQTHLPRRFRPVPRQQPLQSPRPHRQQ